MASSAAMKGDGGDDIRQAILDSIDLRTMWRTVWRWRHLVLWLTIAVATPTTFLAYRLTPHYTASVDLVLGIQPVKLGTVQDLVSDLKDDDESIATEVAIIRSRELALKTITELGLDDDPEFNPALEPLGLARVSGLWGLLRPSRDSDAAADRATGGRSMSAVVDVFEKQLKVSNDDKTWIITIAFRSENPVTAAKVANALADAYIVERLDARFQATRRANIWLADRLDALRQDVQVSEDAVARFRSQNGLERVENPAQPGGPPTTLATRQMVQLSAEAVAARTQYLEARSRFAELKRSGLTHGGGAVDDALSDRNLLDVLHSPVIQGLRAQEADAERRAADLSAQYGDKHPKLIAVRAELAGIRGKIRTEIGRVLDTLRNEVQSQEARVQSLDAALGKMKSDAARDDVALVELHDLERQAEANRSLYETFLAQFKQTQNEASYRQPDAAVISRATAPVLPSFPQKTVLILLSVITGAVIGVITALICQDLDGAIRSMDQLRKLLNVRPLGLVPALAASRRSGHRPEHEVLKAPLSAYAESLRGVHTNLILSDVDAPPRIVLVTSALPREGKSSMAMALAQTMARAGQRVMVIDGDLRRPSAHRLAGVPPGPGLVEWLLGRRGLDEIIYAAGAAGIDLIPAGDHAELPPSLLSSTRFRELLRGLRDRYDTIILDSAPVLAVADTRILATLADKTIFIVRWAATSHKVAASALRQLFEAGALVAGAVLVAVDVKAHGKDGYTDSILYSDRLREYYR